MATIRKRGNLQWQAEIRRRGYEPQRKTFTTKADAEAWALTVELEMKRGVFVSRAEAEATTLREALERYQREVTPHKKSAFSEGKMIDAWKRHPLANRYLATLRPSDFAAYRDERLKARKAASTVRLELAVISHLFTIAGKEWGMPLPNPIMNIRKPRVNNARERRLSREEESYLLESLDNPGPSVGNRRNVWMGPLVMFALETAMRQGELLALEWNRVDLARSVAVLADTKNGETRAVPLSPAAVRILKALPRSLNGKVFQTTGSALKQSWERAVVRAQRRYLDDCRRDGKLPATSFLDDLHFHDLRHEATSRLFESGKFDMMEVASITGHKTLSMLKRYTHLRAEDLARKLG